MKYLLITIVAIFLLSLWGLAQEEDSHTKASMEALKAADQQERDQLLHRMAQDLRLNPNAEWKGETLLGLIDLYKEERNVEARRYYLRTMRLFQDDRALPIFEAALESDDDWLALFASGGIYLLDEERGMSLYLDLWRKTEGSRIQGETMKIIESALRSIDPEFSKELSSAQLSGSERIEIISTHMEAGLLYSTENKIKRNLRTVREAVSEWIWDTGGRGKSEMTYQKLIDGGYLSPPEPVAGEKYDDLAFIWAGEGYLAELAVVTDSGEIVRQKPVRGIDYWR